MGATRLGEGKACQTGLVLPQNLQAVNLVGLLEVVLSNLDQDLPAEWELVNQTAVLVGPVQILASGTDLQSQDQQS